MVTNLSFEFGSADTLERVAAEVSRHASFLRFEDGAPAYDSIVLHTNDKPTIEDFITDSFRAVLSRFDGDGIYKIEDGKHKLLFFLPDFDNDLFPATKDEILRYVVLSTTASRLMQRSFGEYAKMVSMEADASLNRAITFLRTRIFPIE